MGKRGNGEGSIYKDDARGVYRAALTLENGKRKFFSAKTREEVSKKLTKALEARENGTIVAAPRQTVALRHLARRRGQAIRSTRARRGCTSCPSWDGCR